MRSKRVYLKPKPLRQDQKDDLQEVYDMFAGGAGRDVIYKRLKDWDRDTDITLRQVNGWLKMNEFHQRQLRPRSHDKLHLTPVLQKKAMTLVQIDLLDLRNTPATGNFKYVVVAIDTFSRYVWVKAITENSKENVLKAVEGMIDQMEHSFPKTLPKIVQTDNGGEFVLLREFLEKRGVKHIYSKPGVPQTQGSVERVNGTIKRFMWKTLLQEGRGDGSWAKVIDRVVREYNQERHHTATKMVPLQAMYSSLLAKKPEEDEVYQTLKEKKERQIRKLNMATGGTGGDVDSQLHSDLKIGDKVRIALNKKTQKKKKNQSRYMWSPETYYIAAVHRDYNRPWQQPSYSLANPPKRTGGLPERKYLRTELQKVLKENEIFRV